MARALRRSRSLPLATVRRVAQALSRGPLLSSAVHAPTGEAIPRRSPDKGVRRAAVGMYPSVEAWRTECSRRTTLQRRVQRRLRSAPGASPRTSSTSVSRSQRKRCQDGHREEQRLTLRTDHGCSHRFEKVRKFVRQFVGAYGSRGLLAVIGDSTELDVHAGWGDGNQDIASAPISVLRSADTPGVHELNPFAYPLPWLVGVPDADEVLRAGAEIRPHLLEKRVRSIRGHVNRIQRLIAVDESDRRARYVTAEWANVQTEGKATQISLRLRRDVRAGPLEREVR